MTPAPRWPTPPKPDTDDQARQRQIRERIRKLDEELDSYRTIVRTEPEAASAVGRWIAEANQERRRLETMLGQQPTTRLTPEDIKALVASLRDITATLAAADPTDKAAVYAEMGIDITYHQDGRVVVESRPRVVESGVGEAFRVRLGLPHPQRVVPQRAPRCRFRALGERRVTATDLVIGAVY
jgi:hypothetical protein